MTTKPITLTLTNQQAWWLKQFLQTPRATSQSGPQILAMLKASGIQDPPPAPDWDD